MTVERLQIIEDDVVRQFDFHGARSTEGAKVRLADFLADGHVEF
jgi:hypothetical protein